MTMKSVLWVCVATLTVAATENITKSLIETDDAYILEAELPDKSTKAVTSKATSTRLLSTGNTAIDGAVVGLGVGVIGSLLVGKLLEEQNKCNPRGRRDTASTRFLPGIGNIFGGKKCPPPPYHGNNQQFQAQQHQAPYQQHSGYQQHNSGYQQPNSGYQSNIGYHQPSSGYQQPSSGYQQQNSGYRQPNSGYQQANSGYRQPNSGYQQQNSGYRQPNSGYQQQNSAYRQPNSGYQQQNSAYRQPNSGYQQPNSPYRQQNSGYQQPTSGGYQPGRNQQSSFSQTNSHKATPATFSSGLSPGRHHSPLPSVQSPQRNPVQVQAFHPVGRSLPKADSSKINFGR